MTTDRLLFKEKETGTIWDFKRETDESLTRQIASMKTFGFEYLGPLTHSVGVGSTSLNELGIGDLLSLIDIENDSFNCDFRLTIENGKITRYSCTYQGGD